MTTQQNDDTAGQLHGESTPSIIDSKPELLWSASEVAGLAMISQPRFKRLMATGEIKPDYVTNQSALFSSRKASDIVAKYKLLK